MTPAQRHAIEAAKRLRAEMEEVGGEGLGQMVHGLAAKGFSRVTLPLAGVVVLAFADAIDALQQEEADGEAD